MNGEPDPARDSLLSEKPEFTESVVELRRPQARRGTILCKPWVEQPKLLNYATTRCVSALLHIEGGLPFSLVA
jgi:hypothetical protein